MKLVLATIATLLGTTAVNAQTIYPLNRAEILAGSKFDLKVEFPGAPKQADVKVTIDGQDAATVTGGTVSFVEKEDGQDYSAYYLRDVSLAKAGTLKVEASAGGAAKAVTWEVFDTPKGRVAKNVILFVGDGLSIAQRTAARLLSKGMVEGRYNASLAMEEMPYMAMVSTSGTDTLVTDSANSMSAYTTGHKSCNNALGVYCAKNKSNLAHPKVETIGELVKRKANMAVGIVTNSEIEDATPAGVIAHTRRRADYNDIVKMFFDTKPDIIMGGGSPNFLPKSVPGSKRADEDNFVEKFKTDGYAFAATATEMRAAFQGGATKLLGLFNTSNVDGAYDQRFKKGSTNKFPDQPDLVEQTKLSIDALSKNPNGFFLMVESARIDKYAHSLDWERSVFDTILLDNAVKAAKAFADKDGNTLVIVVPDHAHMVGIIGTYDDDLPGKEPRDRLANDIPVYETDKDGYPVTVDVKKRPGFMFGGYPDHCYDSKPHLDGEFVPAVKGAAADTYVANEKYCVDGAVRVAGNIQRANSSGPHSADDIILTAMGPGADAFHGRIENTRVFRAIATALGLAK